MPTSNTLPTHLITGLLGSGKTTTLRHLLQQKPAQERWGIIINEFGDIDIDAATLQSSQGTDVNILSVAGGCVCCSAQYGLTQAINQLLSESSKPAHHPINRLWIEPTGLGHPAKIIDTLTQTKFLRPLALQPIICVITPQQLTAERWKKSAVMRDLVTLSDYILLNKIDLSSNTEIQQSLDLLHGLYPPKSQVRLTEQGVIYLDDVTRLSEIPNTDGGNTKNPNTEPVAVAAEGAFTLLTPQTLAARKDLSGLNQHYAQTDQLSSTFVSALPDATQCTLQTHAEQRTLLSIGWVFKPNVQFNRVKLKTFFTDLASALANFAPVLNRAKGLLKTGNEWQLINWSEGILTFQEIAWRQDNRLELLFTPSSREPQNSVKNSPADSLAQIKAIENQLFSCINLPR